MTPVVVLTTTEKREDAVSLASLLVDTRLAACVNLFPVESFYRWEGKVQSSAEYKLIIKTAEEKWKELQHFLFEHHPYSVPEITKLNAEMSEYYLAWLADSLI